MHREDAGMAFLLQYENVAWYEEGSVRILDRRIYPTQIQYVECHTYHEVVTAIRDMVTQSAGPYTAVGMGMALAAYEVRDQTDDHIMSYLKQAAQDFADARITTKHRYHQIAQGCITRAKQALIEDDDPVEAIRLHTIDALNHRYATMEKVAAHLLEQIPYNGTVLTQCFGETIIGMLCRVAKKKESHIRFYHAETRPYLQGARLTASVCCGMGFESTVITDNMVAYVMQEKGVDIFTSAADTIAMDGTIANKIGTLQMAILAQYYHIPYYVTGIPDRGKQCGSNIQIEERDASQILEIYGVRHVIDGVRGIYPAFDITPAALIRGIITDQGLFAPDKLCSYFDKEHEAFY